MSQHSSWTQAGSWTVALHVRRVQASCDASTSFNSAVHSVETHVATFVAERSIVHPADISFVQQAVYGVTRYSSMLSAFKAAFYHHCGGRALRNHAPLYSLLTYLAVIRLEDLGAQGFGQLLTAIDAQQAAVWASFVMSEEHLKAELREEWAQIYDKAFVDQRIGVLVCQDAQNLVKRNGMEAVQRRPRMPAKYNSLRLSV